jgi:holo-[acyl-carrier protein] synthase
MNISIGVDCEEVKRFQKVMDKPKLLNRIFTEHELEYCNQKTDPKPHLAVRFAGKEALIKAFSDMDIRINMGDIEILNNSMGVPQARVKGINPGYQIKLSLSHTKDMVFASALVVSSDDGLGTESRDGTDKN